MHRENKAFWYLSDALRMLPKASQERILAFSEHVRHIDYMEPNRDADKAWKTFLRPTLLGAEETARKALSTYAESSGCTIDKLAAEALLSSLHMAEHSGRFQAWKAARGIAIDAVMHTRVGAEMDTRWFLNVSTDMKLDTALVSGLMAVEDLGYKEKDVYRGHALERMKVWESGYGLAGELNGVFYVYAAVPFGSLETQYKKGELPFSAEARKHALKAAGRMRPRT